MKPIATDAPPQGWQDAADRMLDFDWRASDHDDWPKFAAPMRVLVLAELARQKKLRPAAAEPENWRGVLLDVARRNGWTLGEIADAPWHEVPDNMKAAVHENLPIKNKP